MYDEKTLIMAVEQILNIQKTHEVSSDGWYACDEILMRLNIETDGQSMEIVESLDHFLK